MNSLTLVELEVEAVLDSRPLRYIAIINLDELLTGSHLLKHYRVLNLPDPLLDGPEFNEPMIGLTHTMKLLWRSSRSFGSPGRSTLHFSNQQETERQCQGGWGCHCLWWTLKSALVTREDWANSKELWWDQGLNPCVWLQSKTGWSVIVLRHPTFNTPLKFAPRKNLIH